MCCCAMGCRIDPSWWTYLAISCGMMHMVRGSKHATCGALAKYVMVARALAGCVVVRWVVGSILHGGLI